LRWDGGSLGLIAGQLLFGSISWCMTATRQGRRRRATLAHFGRGGTQTACPTPPSTRCRLCTGPIRLQHQPLTSIVFNESEVLRSFHLFGPNDANRTQIRGGYRREHAIDAGHPSVMSRRPPVFVTNIFYPITNHEGRSSTENRTGCLTLGGLAFQGGRSRRNRPARSCPIFPALFIRTSPQIQQLGQATGPIWRQAYPPNAVSALEMGPCGRWTRQKFPLCYGSHRIGSLEERLNLDGGDPVPAGLVNQGRRGSALGCVPKLGLTPGHSSASPSWFTVGTNKNWRR